ncbi:transposase, partial [Corallococcus llansteffanensis]
MLRHHVRAHLSALLLLARNGRWWSTTGGACGNTRGLAFAGSGENGEGCRGASSGPSRTESSPPERRATVPAHLLFLPPYSPDPNPIESCWLKVKTRLRAIGARTHAALIQALRKASLACIEMDANSLADKEAAVTWDSSCAARVLHAPDSVLALPRLFAMSEALQVQRQGILERRSGFRPRKVEYLRERSTRAVTACIGRHLTEVAHGTLEAG